MTHTATPPSLPSPLLPSLDKAVNGRHWARAEKIALNYLRQSPHETAPAERMVAIAGLMVALRRSGQLYDYHEVLEPLLDDLEAFAHDDGETAGPCAAQMAQLLALILAPGHLLRVRAEALIPTS